MHEEQVLVALSQSSPRQQPDGDTPGVQAPPSPAQERQEQVGEPAAHAAPSASLHVGVGVPAQQVSLGVQEASSGLQVGGTAQKPEMHCSVGALQQGFVSEQAVAVAAQVLTGRQKPSGAVGGSLTQERPLQHSSCVQVPSEETHGGAQNPPEQLLEQQSLATLQPWSFSAQLTGTSQVKSRAG
jgi:hypothetical protein